MSSDRYRIRALLKEATFALSEGGDEMIVMQFEFVDGEYAGTTRKWWGMFNTDERADRTMDAMRANGWAGEDVLDLSFVGSKEVELVCEDEHYNGKVYPKIIFVNGAQRLEVKNQLSGARLKSFAAKMKGRLAVGNAKAGAPAASKPNTRQQPQRQRQTDDDDDIPM